MIPLLSPCVTPVIARSVATKQSKKTQNGTTRTPFLQPLPKTHGISQAHNSREIRELQLFTAQAKSRLCASAPNLRKLSAHWKGMPAIIFSFALKNCGQGNLVSQNHGISQAQNSREIRELQLSTAQAKSRLCAGAPNLRKPSAHRKGMPAIIYFFALKNCGQGNLVPQNHGISQTQNSREIRELYLFTAQAKSRLCAGAPNLRKPSAHRKGMPAIIYFFALKNCGQGNLVSQNSRNFAGAE